MLEPRLADLAVEELHVLILDSQHRMTRDVTVTRGLLNSSPVHAREVFREAIAESAAAIVLAHNHPSGDPTPSADDLRVTTELVAAGRVLVLERALCTRKADAAGRFVAGAGRHGENSRRERTR